MLETIVLAMMLICLVSTLCHLLYIISNDWFEYNEMDTEELVAATFDIVGIVSFCCAMLIVAYVKLIQ